LAPSDDDSDPKSLLPKLSRRAFFTGAGASALSATLAQTVAEAAPASPAVLGPEPSSLSLSINGRTVTVQADPATTLAELLRSHLGMTGTKVGCDRGACSACTVWLDGEVAASCMTLAFDARGRQVTTIEGLARGDELHPVQRAFVENDALQCGFCTPGMVMSCAALVERNPKCTLDDVKQAVSGHLCRCGTYPNVFKATLAAAKGGGKGKGNS
jgi:carbon-monoxide dehydrogenase small subunit/xanthine dehydrogenase YagT iron-sulfur-binding subunit